MNLKEFQDQLAKEIPQGDNYIPADQAGIIKIDNIQSMVKESKDWPDPADATKKRTGYKVILTMKDSKQKISCPVSAMNQLIELMAKNNVVAFQVLKSGSGMATKYNISPILG